MTDYKKPHVDFSNLLPQYLRNKTSESLFKNVFNKFLTKDESLPLLGYVGDKVISDVLPALPQPNLERELNTLQPMVYAKVGTEEYVFTFNDIIQKLNLLGVDTDDMDNWATAKSFNYVPPIDLDKFINYPRYFWYGELLKDEIKSQVPYNDKLEPEYYVIGLPGDTSLHLGEVQAVADMDIVLSGPQTIDGVAVVAGDRVLVVNKTSSNPLYPHAENGIYIVNAGAWTRVSTLKNSNQFVNNKFVFVRAGTKHAKTVWTLTVPPVVTVGQTPVDWTRGLRKITDWTLNNFWAHEDDLPAMGINPSLCIQAIAPIVEYDFTLELNDAYDNLGPIKPFSSVMDVNIINAGAGYTSVPTVTIEAPPNFPSVGIFKAELLTTLNVDGSISITVDPANKGVGYVDAPKITITGGGIFTEAVVAYAVLGGDVNTYNRVYKTQDKFLFNQVPQFNLYWLDGSYSGKTSSIFYYAEGAEYDIDSVLKRRIVRDVNGDFVFEQGLLNDDSKIQHFYKLGTELTGIWREGVETKPRWVKRGVDGLPVDYPAGPKNNDAAFGKADVKATTTQHLTSLNQTPILDEYQTVVGDRVLVKDQLVGAKQDNGIYIIGNGYVNTPSVVVNTTTIPTELANIICTVSRGRISSFNIINGGKGYSAIPGETTIDFQLVVGLPTDGTPAKAHVVVRESDGAITEVQLIDGGRWLRAPDADSDSEIIHGIHTKVLNGEKYSNTFWSLDTNNPIVTNITPLEFRQYDDGEGAWSIPDQMFHNMKHENRKQIGYGDLYEHFFSIIRAQPLLEGSAFGFNNWRHLAIRDIGLGGTIKDYNTSFDLFVAIMNQRDISIMSILQFAELQYSQALNTITEFFTQNVNDLLLSGLLGSVTTVNINDPIIIGLFNQYVQHISVRTDLSGIYADTTNPLPNWPATLPYLGLIFDPEDPTMAKRVKPVITFDSELGLEVIIHHDGHRSPAATKDAAYEQALVRTAVPRSNGEMTPGIFSTTVPTIATSLRMFKNQLWYNPSTNNVYFFDVTSDTTPVYPVETGDFWFNRSNNELKMWDQSINGGLGDWVIHTNIADAWKPFVFHNILNSLILKVEMSLYDNVQPLQPSNWNSTLAANSPLLEYELAKYSATNGYDMYAPDYVSSNAFTWNYSSISNGTIAGFSLPGSYPARWFNLYKEYFKHPISGLSTCRPNLEPWILTNETESVFRLNCGSYGTPAMWAYVQTKWSKKLGVDVSGNPTTNPAYGSLLPPYVNPTSPSSGEALLNIIPPGIGNGYSFGDNGPVELVWRKSLEYNYALLRTAFRIDPINFISRTWGLNKAVVAAYELDRSSGRRESWSEFKLHGDTINNPVTRDLDVLFEPLLSKQLLPRSRTWPPSVWPLTDSNALIYSGTDAGTGISQDFPLASPETPISWMLKDLTLTPLGGIWRIVFTDTDGFETELDPVSVGLPYESDWISFTLRDQGLDFELSDRIKITYDGEKYSFEFNPARYKLFNGLNQIYVNLLRYNGTDPSIAFNIVMLRGWELQLGYRVSGLLDTDELKLSSDEFSLHKSSFKALLKQNPAQRDSWLDALRIQLVRIGTTQWDPSGGYNIPKQGMKADDWSFRVETFNPRHPTLSYYNLDTSGPYKTFNALVDSLALQNRVDAEQVLSKATAEYQRLLALPQSAENDALLAIALTNLQTASDALALVNAKNEEWRIYTDVKIDTANPDPSLRTDASGKIVRTAPFIITGLQNTLNFLYGYLKRLEEDGWEFNAGDKKNIDAETGRTITWQLEIEKLIFAIYHGAPVGAGNILNPFLDAVWFKTPRGMLTTFDRPLFSDISTSQLIFDVLGGTISKSNLRVFRQDEISEVVSNIPMLSAHFIVDEYEHVLLFSDYNDMSQSKGLIYDQFLGIRINRIIFDGQRQLYFNGRPSYGGHYLLNNDVRHNIETSVENILGYYDTNVISGDNKTSRAARELLGYKKKNYMSSINMTDKSQFNFWRGLIHNKGSNNSMGAFLNSAKFKSAAMDEYWAVKISDYGDARTLSFPELKLKSKDCEQSYTRLQFLETIVSDTVEPGFTTIISTDENRWFTLDDVGTQMYFEAEPLGIVDFTGVAINSFQTLPWVADHIEVLEGSAEFTNSTTIKALSANVIIRGFAPAKPKFSPIKLIDYSNKQVIAEIPIWDPARGVHQSNATEIIDIIGNDNPAKYNYSVQTVGNTHYDPMRPWGTDQIGKTWFDTTNLGYVPYYDEHIFPSVDERLSRWGVPADWATIDVYEWVGSKIPPSEWDNIAKSEEGNAEIPVEQRASGKVALKELYTRSRTWAERPIAWADSILNNPLLAGSASAALYMPSTSIGNQTLILEFNRFSDYDINVDDPEVHWYLSAILNPLDIDPKKRIPIGQGVLGRDEKDEPASINYQICGYDITETTPVVIQDPNFEFIDIIESPSGNLGVILGPIMFSQVMIGTTLYIRATSLLSNMYQDIEVVDTPDIIGGHILYDYDQLGVAISANVAFDHSTVGQSITDIDLRKAAVFDAFGNPGGIDPLIFHEVYIRETMPIHVFLPFVDDIYAIQNMNNELGPWGWKAYHVPTPQELASDLMTNTKRWTPYYGDYVDLDDTAAVRDRLAGYAAAPLLFSDGTAVEKVKGTWSDWLPLVDEIITHKYITTSDKTFVFDVNPTNVNVYVNGLIRQQKPFTINDNVVTFTDTVNVGDVITVLSRKYVPKTSELNFNPDVLDNPTINVQYKYDYQYVVENVRDAEGNIVTSYYYFWVYNKSTPTKNSKMSIKTATNLLKNNINPYLVLLGIRPTYLYVSDFDIPQPFLHNVDNIYTLRGTKLGVSKIVTLNPVLSTNNTVVNFATLDTGIDFDDTPEVFIADTLHPAGVNWTNTIHMVTNPDDPLEQVSCQIFPLMTTLPVRYTKAAIKGLNLIVTRDNTYKLRFTRDFTLRDDPLNIQLKNVHQEWSLIREAQTKRIPISLWDKMVDAACGENAAGEALPIQSRIDYDARHGTATRYGTADDQIMVDSDLAKSSILNTILNTTITFEQADTKYPDYIKSLDFGTLSGQSQVDDRMTVWFGDSPTTRKTLTLIWNTATPRQINEIFFSVLHNALSSNIEMTDIFKTSYLSVYSVRLLSTVDVLKKLNGAAL